MIKLNNIELNIMIELITISIIKYEYDFKSSEWQLNP